MKINHTVYIKGFNRFMFNKTKCKNKNTFPDIGYKVLVVKGFRWCIKRYV